MKNYVIIRIEVICLTSRMERYYKPSNHTSKRSERNQELYREIYEDGEYSNIEGIATIEKSNEVDITKIKNMLKNREQYQKQRQFRQMIKEPIQTVEEEKPTFEAEKNYDIRDILNKAKNNKKEEEKYHRLDHTGYNILKNLKEKSMQKNEHPDELRELIDTITSNSELNQLATRELSLDLFDDLKSEENTVIENRDSIKALLEEAKKEDQMKKKEKEEMDQSFYTSSLNFGDDDFEQISEQMKPKWNPKIMKTVLSVITGIVIAGIIFLIYSLLK